MDFETLNRRELQALCKLNKIPANITNIAMVDALKSLDTVEGIEEFSNPPRSELVRLSIESPERTEVTSPMVLRSSSRTSAQKKAKTEVNEFLKTPLVSCTKKKDPEASYHRDVESQLNECEDIVQKESSVNHEQNCLPNTPVVVIAATISQMKGAKRSRQVTVKKEDTTTLQRAYNTRRSTRLTTKKYQEKHDVIVLDESDEDSKIEKVVDVDVDVDTNVLEIGDNLKVKLVEIFDQVDNVDLEERHNKSSEEEKSGKVENLKPDSEGKLDNHIVTEVMAEKGIEENIMGNTVDFVNPKKQKASMKESLIEVEGIEESIESAKKIEVTSPRSSRKKAKIAVNEVMKTPLVSINRKNDLASEFNLEKETTTSVQRGYSTRRSARLTVEESERSEPVKMDEVNVTSEDDKGNKCIQDKHDELENVDLEERQKEAKSGQVDNSQPDSEGIVKGNDAFFVEADDMDANVQNSSDQLILKPQGIQCADSGMVNKVLESNGDPNTAGEENPNEFLKLDKHNFAKVMSAEGIEENISRNTEQLNQEGDAVEVTHESAADVSLYTEENQIITNANDDDVINHPALSNSPTSTREVTEVSDNKNNETKLEVVVIKKNNEKEGSRDEKPKNVFNKNSLRQLKKQLKATLLNSPTSIRIKTEVTDIKNPQVVVVEENEKAKSLNNGCSLRQLKKQLKAISVKYKNMDANKVNNTF